MPEAHYSLNPVARGPGEVGATALIILPRMARGILGKQMEIRTCPGILSKGKTLSYAFYISIVHFTHIKEINMMPKMHGSI